MEKEILEKVLKGLIDDILFYIEFHEACDGI